MTNMIPVNTIVLHRAGKRITPTIGKVFDFSDKEIADILTAKPGALRKPIVEAIDSVATEVPSKPEKPVKQVKQVKPGKADDKPADPSTEEGI